jgi:alpha-mannosidase
MHAQLPPPQFPMLLALLLLGAAPGALAFFRDDLIADKMAEPPYPMPEDWTYNTVAAPNATSADKINVHLVPHTHDDTGWQVTVDQYLFTDVYYVLDTVIPRLAEDPARRFIYVEIGFFARWWDVQPKKKQDLTRMLVKEKRLEFINGGWCMHDEASPFYVEMIDQTTRGHQFLKKNFVRGARGPASWLLDTCCLHPRG